ncbi:hypothetical protein [Roseovarius sp. ZX-A-9]|uniref:hypothetical protein n=1 Tax=Roseovarius sp. ZX-A-9 TaxID=3014783 RepID=UPI002330C0C7|nr:hypothetical protein [Roseovarius sp. ZX-A-9]
MNHVDGRLFEQPGKRARPVRKSLMVLAQSCYCCSATASGDFDTDQQAPLGELTLRNIFGGVMNDESGRLTSQEIMKELHIE